MPPSKRKRAADAGSGSGIGEKWSGPVVDTGEVRWTHLRAPQLRDLAKRGAIVIIPAGSVEQHGPHLPVGTDIFNAESVAIGAAKQLSESGMRTLVAPSLWMGLAEHHMAFGGTFSVDLATYHSILRCVVRSIIRDGFSRILVVNGHGGNVTALTNICQELSTELSACYGNLRLLALTYFTVPKVVAAFKDVLEAQGGVLHAGEAETSILLSTHEPLVDLDALTTLKGPAGLEGFMAAAPGVGEAAAGGAVGSRFSKLCPCGVIGVPQAASRAKGEKLLAAATAGVAEVISQLAESGFWEDAYDARALYELEPRA